MGRVGEIGGVLAGWLGRGERRGERLQRGMINRIWRTEETEK